MNPLPIDTVLPAVVAAVTEHRAAVVVAPPGSGKTTRVPPALLDAGHSRVLVLQPRRVAARLAAARIAAERGRRLGDEIGYHVRFDKRSGPLTRLELLTEGLLLRRLQADPFLEGVGAIVLDEFHERSLDVDLALALLAEVRAERNDLAVVVMSATMDPGPVAAFLGGAPVIEAAGRVFPVEITWADHTVEPWNRGWEAEVAAAVRRALAEAGGGHVLAFLPGVAEIERTAGLLADLRPVPLHGSLPPAAQDLALAPSDRRKVVLATNLAETSVTLEGVSAVVDSGLRRAPVFEPAIGLTRLETTRISRASAEQRAGRAGRTGPGRCYRLWTTERHGRLAEADPPEVATADLAPTVLQLRRWGADPRTFQWFEAPSEGRLSEAEAMLDRLGLLGTSLGREVAELPVHPRLGLVVAAGRHLGCPKAAASVAALASERLGPGPRALSERLGEVQRHPWLRQVRDALHDGGEEREPDAVIDALLAGFPDRVGQRRGAREPRFLLAGGSGAVLADGGPDELDDCELVVAVALRAGRRGQEHRIEVAAPLERARLPVEHIVEGVEHELVDGMVRAWATVRYLSLVLERHPCPADPVAGADLLALELRRRPDLLSPDERTLQLQARIALLGRVMPELDLPRSEIGDVSPEMCRGCRSVDDVRARLFDAIMATLTWPQRQALDSHAPVRFTVPSGASVPLVYGDDVVLAARIQQLFGMQQTPRIAGGRVPLTLHLLAPNGRPAQVTQDLDSFWANTWPEVRKALRGRYPRHAWPEDPLQAEPLDRPKRR